MLKNDPQPLTGTFSEAKEKESHLEKKEEGLSSQRGFSFPKILFFLLAGLGVLGVVLIVFRFILPRFQKPQEITLTYWGLWEPESVMNEVIADWEKEHPYVKINYLQQSHYEYRERLQSALARGEGPDLFRFHLTWVPMLKDQLEPLPSSLMSSHEFEASFFPSASVHLRSSQGYLGLPLEVDTLALFYNKTLFQTAGKSPPHTWDELRQLAREITVYDQEGRIQTAGVALGVTGNIDHWSDILALMMLQNGADLERPTDSFAEDALLYYTLFSKVDRVWEETLPSSILAFATGKVAMIFGFSWDVFEIKKINPELDFGVVPVPQLPGTKVNWASFWVEGVNKQSPHKKEAWEFLYFLSQPENLEKLYQAESQLRLFGEPYPRREMIGLIEDHPWLAVFVKQADSAKTWYLCSRTWDNGLNDRMIKYFEDAVNAVNAGKSPQEALKTTAAGVSQLLSQYRLTTPLP